MNALAWAALAIVGPLALVFVYVMIWMAWALLLDAYLAVSAYWRGEGGK